jgi:hypothetical protein
MIIDTASLTIHEQTFEGDRSMESGLASEMPLWCGIRCRGLIRPPNTQSKPVVFATPTMDPAILTLMLVGVPRRLNDWVLSSSFPSGDLPSLWAEEEKMLNHFETASLRLTPVPPTLTPTQPHWEHLQVLPTPYWEHEHGDCADKSGSIFVVETLINICWCPRPLSFEALPPQSYCSGSINQCSGGLH